MKARLQSRHRWTVYENGGGTIPILCGRCGAAVAKLVVEIDGSDFAVQVALGYRATGRGRYELHADALKRFRYGRQFVTRPARRWPYADPPNRRDPRLWEQQLSLPCYRCREPVEIDTPGLIDTARRLL